MTTMNTLTNDEKFTASFVFYYSFADMISKIPDREIRLQAYEMLFEYALFGTEPQIEHWAVDMVFSAVKPQIDANNKRRKNGKKGGRKPAQEKATQTQPAAQTEAATKAQAEAAARAQAEAAAQAQAEAAAQAQAEAAAQAQAEAAARAQAEAAAQAQAVVTPTPRAQTAWQDDSLRQSNKIITFGANKYPTTPEELSRFEAFAYKLFEKYHGGKPALADIERVMERSYSQTERPDGKVIIAFDRDKADLLEYAFEQAKNADKLNWRYLEGMYRNFAARDIVTGAEALQYDLGRTQRFI